MDSLTYLHKVNMANTALIESVIKAARIQVDLKTPFRHQGRVPGLGLDCAGLLVHCFLENNIDVVDIPGYGRSPAKAALECALKQQPKLVRIYQLEPGCILLMRFAKEPQHLALYTFDNTVIHSYESVGLVCEHILDEFWRKKIVGMFKITE